MHLAQEFFSLLELGIFFNYFEMQIISFMKAY